ncbi:COR domain-containing protein [Verrucomicrobium sp. BvORR034]|uniref:COR domain-containing protein n=1 Tax=Verrucomicrobium sp. BvORR034 TaxID=1396418 RepID=UPI000678F317|nr:COR domain-containing protein [Verrucomicrobium sp. BvORR034]
MYRLLNDHPLNQRHGLLEYPYFVEVLKKVDGYKYVQHESFIWEMMKRFQLGFEFEAPGHKEPGMLIPDLLQKEEGYRGQWSNSLAFIYKYTVLPQAVVSRFIVAMHRHIKPNSAWRYGAILEREGCQARVKADLEDHVLEIQVMGPEASLRSFLEVIREVLDSIHEGFSEKLGAQEFVPVPGNPGKREPYRKLLQMERDGKTEVYIEDVGDVPLSQLLNGIAPARRRQDLGEWERHREERHADHARPPATSTSPAPAPDPAEEASSTNPAPVGMPWWLWSVILAAGGTALILTAWYTPWQWLRYAIAVFAVLTLIFMKWDPQLFHRRLAVTGLSILSIGNALGFHLDAKYEGQGMLGGLKWVADFSPSFNIVMAFLVGWMLFLDFLNRRASKS